jgi:hypothetical protein
VGPRPLGKKSADGNREAVAEDLGQRELIVSRECQRRAVRSEDLNRFRLRIKHAGNDDAGVEKLLDLLKHFRASVSRRQNLADERWNGVPVASSERPRRNLIVTIERNVWTAY